MPESTAIKIYTGLQEERSSADFGPRYSRSHYIVPMNRENTRTIDRRGGTVLHLSRINPSKIQKLPDHLFSNGAPV